MKEVFLGIFFICLLAIGSRYPILEVVGKITLFSCAIYCVIGKFVRDSFKLKLHDKFIALSIFLMLLWFLIRTINIEGIRLYLQFFLLIVFLYFLEIRLTGFKNIINLVVIIISIISMLYYWDVYEFFLNPNVGGIISLCIGCCAFIVNGTKNRRFVIIVLTFILLLIWNSRSVLIGIILSTCVIWIYKKYRFGKLLLISFFVTIPILVYFLQGILDNYYTPNLDAIVLEYTGKNLDTGRLRIWSSIFQVMSFKSDLIGLGGGFNFWNLMDDKVSLHSGYIYLFASYGIIGLSLFSISVLLIILKCLKNKAYFSACLLLTFVFREFFEVTLVYNNMALALFFWGILAKGVLDKKCDLI